MDRRDSGSRSVSGRTAVQGLRLRARGPLAVDPAPSASGFTLIELIIVLGMLVAVLGVTYRMILDCLEADRTIERLSLPEKVGEGIISQVRTDLTGTIYRKLGRRVFFVTDSGLPPDARDELRFITTVDPTPIEETTSSGTVAVTELRSLVGIAYALRPTRLADAGITAYTLFRKEIYPLDVLDPLEGEGRVFEVYDKVAYFSVECYDGWSWYADWDSEQRILDEQAELAAQAEEEEGIARVSSPRTTGAASGLTTPGVDPLAAEGGQELLPAAGVPVAVRVEIGIYVAPGGKLLRDAQNAPLLKTYSTVVPLLVAQRLPIELDDLAMDDGMGGESGAGEEGAAGDVVRNAQFGGPGGGKVRPEGGRGGRGGREGGAFPGGRGGRGGRDGGAPGGRGGRGAPGGTSGGGRGGRTGAGGIAPGGALPGGIFPGGGAPSGGGRGGR